MLFYILLILVLFVHIQNYDIHVIDDNTNAWPHKNVILQQQCIAIYDHVFSFDDQKKISNIFLNFREIMEHLCKQLDKFIHENDKNGMEKTYDDMSKLLHNIEPQFHEKSMYFKHSLIIHIKNYNI